MYVILSALVIGIVMAAVHNTDVMSIISGPTIYVWNTFVMSPVTKYDCGVKVPGYV
jgi:hypothetical protein